jgi:hypothetical protein
MFGLCQAMDLKGAAIPWAPDGKWEDPVPERRGPLWNFMRLNSGKSNTADKKIGIRCQKTDDSM